MAFFTAHERNELRGTWGSQSTRLTRDSFLPFASCRLCLLPARDPVSCPTHGHLFCRECALSNLLAQNKELKRLRKEAEQRKAEDEEENKYKDAEAQARAVEDFERVEAGWSVKGNGGWRQRTPSGQIAKIMGKEDAIGDSKAVKRKLGSDEDDHEGHGGHWMKRQALEQHDEKGSLPSFWIPSQTPNNKKVKVQTIKQQPNCPAVAADQPHDLTLKALVSVHFANDQISSRSSEGTAARICPSCDKVLSNSSKAVLAKPCGHVLCKACSDKFQQPLDDSTVRCFVCQENVTPRRQTKRKDREGCGKTMEKDGTFDQGLVELSCEGTGFAGGGKNMVKKFGLAFQC